MIFPSHNLFLMVGDPFGAHNILFLCHNTQSTLWLVTIVFDKYLEKAS